MLVVGLTGGYASGKSTVAAMFVDLGAVLIDADQIARDLVKPGKPAWSEIVSHFGRKILLENDEIDRKALANIVFRDDKQREELNSIVHPKVLEEELRAIKEIRVKMPEALIILNVPLLIESGHFNYCDKIVVVTVDEDIHVKRLMERDGFTREEALRRISAQMPLSEKAEYADYVIDNNGSIQETETQVKKIFSLLKKDVEREVSL